jgi:hypothetical protein
MFHNFRSEKLLGAFGNSTITVINPQFFALRFSHRLLSLLSETKRGCDTALNTSVRHSYQSTITSTLLQDKDYNVAT